MSTVIGIELGTARVRAVWQAGRAPARVINLPWAPDRPEVVIAQLRDMLGAVDRIGVAIGLAHLHVTHVQLPPATRDDQRRMVALDPERWFAVAPGTAMAVGLTPEGSTAFAVQATALEQWVAACSAWAPVTLVEASPVALLRALLASGWQGGRVALEAGPGERGLMDVTGGEIQTVRRGRAADLTDVAMPVAVGQGIEPEYGAALGAAQGAGGGGERSLAAMLLTPALEAKLIAARARRVWQWSAIAAAALLFALWGADRSRARALDAVEAAIARTTPAAATGRALVDSALALDREVFAIAGAASSSPDPLSAVAALSDRLPEHAVIQRLQVTENEWRIEGSAQQAAAVLAALAAEPTFTHVRFAAPSARFREANERRETFAIAFALR